MPKCTSAEPTKVVSIEPCVNCNFFIYEQFLKLIMKFPFFAIKNGGDLYTGKYGIFQVR